MKKAAIAAAVICFMVPPLFVVAGVGVWVAQGMDGYTAPGRAHAVTSDIPIEMGGLYERAAERFGIPWEVLAAVGRVECRHGLDPRCSSPNEAGAERVAFRSCASPAEDRLATTDPAQLAEEEEM